MFRPSDMQLSSTASEHTAPATVAERHNLGWNIKYHLKFDDDVVRGEGGGEGGGAVSVRAGSVPADCVSSTSTMPARGELQESSP